MAEQIIIGVDGSEPSRAALRWALKRATSRHADITLAHVADDSFLSDSAAFLSEAQRASEQMLDAEKRFAAEQGFAGKLTGIALVGHPIAEMERLSKQADLLVLGDHEGSKLSGSFLGTRSVKIAAVSQAPVAVIPTKEHTPTLGVVVGIDGSAASRRAIAYAAQEASFAGVELNAVYAWMPPLTPGLEYLWSDDLATSQRRAAEEAITIGTAGLAERYPDLTVNRIILESAPVAAMLSEAQGAELLVIGSRGRGGFSRLLLGSVSHGVLAHLPCPTVVTREVEA